MAQDLRDVTIMEKTATSTRVEVFRMDIGDKSAYADDGLIVGYADTECRWHRFCKAAVVSAQFMPIAKK